MISTRVPTPLDGVRIVFSKNRLRKLDMNM